jgi:bacterial/archaeal transporter family protein
MPVWVLFSIASLLSWGVSGYLRKQATVHITPWVIVVFQSLTVMTLATIAVVIRGGPVLTTEAVLLAIAGGSFQYLANISLAFSLARGPASIVVPVTSMYPVVTLVLAFFILGETISATQALGLVCSAGALYAFSR